MRREELLEILDDLQHDLGKHLLLPVALLPVGAPDAQVRDAVARGLRQIAVWQRFGQRAGAELRQDPGFVEVDACVARAIGWVGAPVVDRAAVHADFAAVGQALRAWRSQVAGG